MPELSKLVQCCGKKVHIREQPAIWFKNWKDSFIFSKGEKEPIKKTFTVSKTLGLIEQY